MTGHTPSGTNAPRNSSPHCGAAAADVPDAGHRPPSVPVGSAEVRGRIGFAKFVEEGEVRAQYVDVGDLSGLGRTNRSRSTASPARYRCTSMVQKDGSPIPTAANSNAAINTRSQRMPISATSIGCTDLPRCARYPPSWTLDCLSPYAGRNPRHGACRMVSGRREGVSSA